MFWISFVSYFIAIIFFQQYLLKLFSLTGKRVFGGEWMHIYMARSFHSSPESITKHCLLTSYTATQNKKLKIKLKNHYFL